MSNIENNFVLLFKTVDELTLFVNTNIDVDLSLSEIEVIFKRAAYVEKLVIELNKNGSSSSFEWKLNEHRKILSLREVELASIRNICDAVLEKFFSQPLSSELALSAVRNYLLYCTQERFENVMKYTVGVRNTFLRISEFVSTSCDQLDIESTFLLDAWTKLLQSQAKGADQVNSIVQALLSDQNNYIILLNILTLNNDKNWLNVQNIVCQHVAIWLHKSYQSQIWENLLNRKEILENVLITRSELLEVVFDKLRSSGEKHKYNHNIIGNVGNDNWENDELCFHFDTLLKIAKFLFDCKSTRKSLNDFMKNEKVSGNRKLWEDLEERIR